MMPKAFSPLRSSPFASQRSPRSSPFQGEDLGEKDLGGKAQQGKGGKDLGRKREKLSGGGKALGGKGGKGSQRGGRS